MASIDAIILDRDGTLIDEPEDENVDRWDKFQIKPGLNSLVLLSRAGYQLFIATNQGSIAEGTLEREFYDATNTKLLRILEQVGVEIKEILTCPHTRAQDCLCRKPKTGLFQDILKRFEFNPDQSYVIGDRSTDIELGKNLGIKTIMLPSRFPVSIKPDYVALDISQAVQYILDHAQK